MRLEGKTIKHEEDIFVFHAQFCKVFSNPVRLKVLWNLSDGERTVTDLASAIGVSLTNLSQHLRIMRAQGVVEARRDGQNIWYSVSSHHFFAGCLMIRKGIREVMQRYPGGAARAEDSNE